jgi:AraC-like DNA-binding protein
VSTGFPDQSYFDRRFKQAFHKSPRQFRLDLCRGHQAQESIDLPEYSPKNPGPS